MRSDGSHIVLPGLSCMSHGVLTVRLLRSWPGEHGVPQEENVAEVGTPQGVARVGSQGGHTVALQGGLHDTEDRVPEAGL